MSIATVSIVVWKRFLYTVSLKKIQNYSTLNSLNLSIFGGHNHLHKSITNELFRLKVLVPKELFAIQTCLNSISPSEVTGKSPRSVMGTINAQLISANSPCRLSLNEVQSFEHLGRSGFDYLNEIKGALKPRYWAGMDTSLLFCSPEALRKQQRAESERDQRQSDYGHTYSGRAHSQYSDYTSGGSSFHRGSSSHSFFDSPFGSSSLPRDRSSYSFFDGPFSRGRNSHSFYDGPFGSSRRSYYDDNTYGSRYFHTGRNDRSHSGYTSGSQYGKGRHQYSKPNFAQTESKKPAYKPQTVTPICPESGNADLNKKLLTFAKIQQDRSTADQQKETLEMTAFITELLGLSIPASETAIKDGYRKKAKLWHTDAFTRTEDFGKLSESEKSKQKEQATELFKILSRMYAESQKKSRKKGFVQ